MVRSFASHALTVTDFFEPAEPARPGRKRPNPALAKKHWSGTLTSMFSLLANQRAIAVNNMQTFSGLDLGAVCDMNTLVAGNNPDITIAVKNIES